jgi:hypothetical protein
VFVLLSEPARVLLGWPSGAQHLFAGTATVLAVHEALEGRIAGAGLAALAGVLSHESAALALPLLPLVAWQEGRGRREVLGAGAMALGVAAIWAVGYAIALHHGVTLPPGHAPGESAAGAWLRKLPGLAARALAAAVNLEDVHGPNRVALVAGALLLTVALAFELRAREARQRLRSAAPALLVAAAWFGLGVLPLAALLPDWNAWRAWTPTLGFAIATTGALGAVSPWLAGGWVALKLVALLLSPGAPSAVNRVAPERASHVSFTQIVRLQRIVNSSRASMLSRVSRLPHRGRVCFWEIPRLAEFAFQNSRALQVWYRDSTLTWGGFTNMGGFDASFDACLEYRYDGPVVSVVIPGVALDRFRRAADQGEAGHFDASDSLLHQSVAALEDREGYFYSSALAAQAVNAFNRGAYTEVESLSRLMPRLAQPEPPMIWTLRAKLALMRGDRTGALEDLIRALDINPGHGPSIELAREMGVLK